MEKYFRKIVNKIRNGGLVATLSKAFITKGIVALGSVFYTAVLGQLYGASIVGVFALSMAITVGTCSMFSRIGMHIVLVRDVSIYRKSPEVLIYLKWAIKRGFLISIFFSFLVIILSSILGAAFHSENLKIGLIGTAFAIPSFTVSYIMSGFFKAIRKPSDALLQENGLVALIAAILILILYFIFNTNDILLVGITYSISAFLVMIYGLLKIKKWAEKQNWKFNDSKVETSISKKEFMNSSYNFFTLNLTDYLKNRFNIIIVGFFVGSYELGLFNACQQFGRLISFVLMVINSVFPPRFASLFHEGKKKQLEILAKKSSTIGIVLVSPLLITIFIFPEFVLKVYGNEFSSAISILYIIAIGHTVNIFTGSVGFLLNMTGYEKINRNIALFNVVIGLTLYISLVPTIGVLGGAIALSITLITQNLFSLYYVWKKIGIWTIPTPNILQKLGFSSEVGKI